jgi:hypothetical protein
MLSAGDADGFSGAHGAEYGFVIEADRNPFLDVGVLVENNGRSVEGCFRVGLGLRCVKDVGLRP